MYKVFASVIVVLLVCHSQVILAEKEVTPNPKIEGPVSLSVRYADYKHIITYCNGVLYVCETPSNDDCELKITAASRPPIYPRFAHIKGDILYIADKTAMYYSSIGNLSFVKHALSPVFGSTCALSTSGYFALVSAAGILVSDLKGEAVLEHNFKEGASGDILKAQAHWINDRILCVYFRDKAELFTLDASCRAVESLSNISEFEALGGGYILVRSNQNRKAETKKVYCYSDSEKREVTDKNLYSPNVVPTGSSYYASYKSSSAIYYYSKGEIIAASYRKAHHPFSWYDDNYLPCDPKCEFTSSHRIVLDKFSRRHFAQKLTATDLIPCSSLATAGFVTSAGYLPMLFADGTWLRMRISDRKPEDIRTYEYLSGDIASAIPMKQQIAVWAGTRIYTIDDAGCVNERFCFVEPSHIVAFEQGGAKYALTRKKDGFAALSATVSFGISARLFEFMHNDPKAIVARQIGETDSKKFRVSIEKDDKYSWQTHGFVGETGVFMAQDDKNLELCPAQQALKVVRIPNTEKVRNSVWAGGIVVIGGTAMSLFDGTTVRLFDYDADTPVSAWKLPGLSHAILCFTGDKVQEEKMCAVNLAEQDESKRVIWLDTPIGTRWIARNGDELLLISSFGRLLGRMPIPEGIKQ